MNSLNENCNYLNVDILNFYLATNKCPTYSHFQDKEINSKEIHSKFTVINKVHVYITKNKVGADKFDLVIKSSQNIENSEILTKSYEGLAKRYQNELIECNFKYLRNQVEI